MNSIKSRVLLLFVLCLSAIGAFGFLTYSSFTNYIELQLMHERSYAIVEGAISLQNKQLGKERLTDLEKWAVQLEPQFRSEALQNVLKSASDKNINFLLKAENEYRRYNMPMILYFKERVTYFGAITLFAAVVFILGATYFVLNKVFLPLKDLSTKMTDFIHNRYSYKFSIPQADEIGQLHSKFNTMAQKVLSQIEELKSLDKAKTEFLSIASHELRTPLTSIKGSLSLLNSGVIGEMNSTAVNLMTIALDETDRLIRLINELLDLAKIEARQFPLNCDWVYARNLIDKTFGSLQGFCQTTKTKLLSVGAEDIEFYVDSDRVQQVLTNLLSNAIKYSPEGEAVTVKFIADQQNQIRVEVTDRGQGIAPEDQEIIFEKFRQATNSQNPLVKGTGLGLAIAKALIEQHGGLIGVHSRPGEGSTFYFTVPKWRPYRKQNKAAA